MARTVTEVIRKLRSIPELQALHTTDGAWDLVVEIQTNSLKTPTAFCERCARSTASEQRNQPPARLCLYPGCGQGGPHAELGRRHRHPGRTVARPRHANTRPVGQRPEFLAKAVQDWIAAVGSKNAYEDRQQRARLALGERLREGRRTRARRRGPTSGGLDLDLLYLGLCLGPLRQLDGQHAVLERGLGLVAVDARG